MIKISAQTISGVGVRCTVCETHARPLFIPWLQHAIGCPVRTAEIERYKLDVQQRPAITRAA